MKAWRGIVSGLAVLTIASAALEVGARERSRSGTYQGRGGSGNFSTRVQRSSQNGQSRMKKETTWQGERGTGTRRAERNWDRTQGQGSYSTTTTGPGGKTISRQGTVTRNEDNSFRRQGTITGPQGKTTAVESTARRNDDGSIGVSKTYTKPSGETVSIEKSIVKTEDGRSVAGSYTSSDGKSGTFDASVTRGANGDRTVQKSLTNQDGRTWRQEVDYSRDGNTITREVTTTGPDGKSRTRSGSVAITTSTTAP